MGAADVVAAVASGITVGIVIAGGAMTFTLLCDGCESVNALYALTRERDRAGS